MDEKKGVSRMTDDEPNTATVEIEGGGCNWWYVCGEGHGTIDDKDVECPHCKCILLWEGGKLWQKH